MLPAANILQGMWHFRSSQLFEKIINIILIIFTFLLITFLLYSMALFSSTEKARILQQKNVASQMTSPRKKPRIITRNGKEKPVMTNDCEKKTLMRDEMRVKKKISLFVPANFAFLFANVTKYKRDYHLITSHYSIHSIPK
jgi:hypothetical protein